MDNINDEKQTAEVMDCLLSLSRIQNEQVGEFQFWQNCDTVYQEGEQIIWKLDPTGNTLHGSTVEKQLPQNVPTEIKHDGEHVLCNINKALLLQNLPNHAQQFTQYQIVETPSLEANTDVDPPSGKTDSSVSENVDVEVVQFEEDDDEEPCQSKFVNGFGRNQRKVDLKEGSRKKKKSKKVRKIGKQTVIEKKKVTEALKSANSVHVNESIRRQTLSLRDHELTKLEDSWEQVAERLSDGCDCSCNCYEGLHPEKVYRHRLNIADLTKAEHDMYLMGVILASIQNPDGTCRKKERLRMRTTYSYRGKKVCLTAFLYLEHVTLYQLKRIRKHLLHHGVSPRIHGNHGRKPSNTFPLDIYQHANNFVQDYIKQNHVKTVHTKSEAGKNLVSYRLPPECTRKVLHDEYRRFCEKSMPSAKIMQYSTFTSFFKKQFPNIKFRKAPDKTYERKVDDNLELFKEDKLSRSRNKSKSKVVQTSDSCPIGLPVECKVISQSPSLEVKTSAGNPPYVILETSQVVLDGDSFILQSRSDLKTFLTTDLPYDGSENLAVRDVSDLLQAQYAIITGGKTGNGCPIITFPDIGNFSTLGDVEYQRLMLYLTSVPSLQEADAGFVLVIDRRNDHWNSAKPTLMKLSGYFPGLVHIAYVLRPTGLIKKAISDVAKKLISKDDFKFKVVVCNSLEELHFHVDKSQLTPDLGGTVQYNHAEWIQEREQLEKVSNVMREVSWKLNSYIRKLQETPLPTDTNAIRELIASQEEEYVELKEVILDAAKQGESLLDTFKKNMPINTGDHTCQVTVPETDKFGNISAVERLLVQLEETERTFCEFQSEHSLRVRQHLEHQIFLKDVTELEENFQSHLNTMSEMVEIGETVERVDALVKETHSFHKLALSDIERAEEVIANGQQLLKSKQFSSVDTLQADCDTLKRLSIILTERIEHRLAGLHKHRELQEHIDTANAWCAKGIELLSVQHLDKSPGGMDQVEKSLGDIREFLETGERLELNGPEELFKDSITPETKALVTQVLQRIADVTSMCEKRLTSLQSLTAKRPVQTVTPEPGVPLQPSHGAPILVKPKILRKANTVAKLEDPWNQNKPRLVDEEVPTGDPAVLKSKRDHILTELLETEQVYVSEMLSIINGYKREMDSPEMIPLMPPSLLGKGEILFGNLEEIHAFHSNTFLRDLQNCISNTELVALCFTHRKSEFYKLYSTYCQNTPRSEQLREVLGDRNIFFGACQIKLGHKLPLAAYLLKPIQRITKYQLLLRDLLRCSEDPKCRSQLQDALECMLVVLKCVNDSMHQIAITGFRGDLAEQGDLLMQGSFSVWTESKKIRELRLTPMQRHIFLYRKAILFCKKENKENSKATYHFKRYLQMSQVGLTESVKGDTRKFEIWLQGRQEVHTIQAATLEQKQAWVLQIKQVLLEQLAELRGANIRQYSLHKTPLLHRPLRQTSSWESETSMETGAGSSNRAFSCDETALSHQALMESGEESSDNSNSDDEETFSNENSTGGRYLVLADYRAQSHNEISLQEGDLVEVLKIGCGGWWFVQVLGHFYQGLPIEGWAPSAYLEPSKRKHQVQDGRTDHKNIVSHAAQ